MMKTFVIELSGGPFGSSSLRVVNQKYVEQRGWQLVETEQGRKLLVDDKGNVEAMVVDEVPAANAPKFNEEDRQGVYM